MSDFFDRFNEMDNVVAGNVTVSWPITLGDILSLVCGFLPGENGGSGYWASFQTKNVEGIKRDRKLALSEQFTLGQVTFMVFDREDEEDEGKELTVPMLLKGLELWSRHTGRGLDDFGNIDAGDSDSIMQFALFGEIVYC